MSSVTGKDLSVEENQVWSTLLAFDWHDVERQEKDRNADLDGSAHYVCLSRPN
jgi:hypothetical protein